jgi:thioesterase domain-containing protein
VLLYGKREATRHPAFDRPDFGWEEAAPGSVQAVVAVPGDHFSVMNEPDTLATQLLSWINKQAARIPA